MRGETNQAGNMIQKQAVLVIKLLSLSSKSNFLHSACDAGSLHKVFLLCQVASYGRSANGRSEREIGRQEEGRSDLHVSVCFEHWSLSSQPEPFAPVIVVGSSLQLLLELPSPASSCPCSGIGSLQVLLPCRGKMKHHEAPP